MTTLIESLAATAIKAGREAAASIKADSEFNLLHEMERMVYSSIILKAMNDVLSIGTELIAYNNIQEKNFNKIAATDTFTIGVIDTATMSIVDSADLKFNEVDFIAKS